MIGAFLALVAGMATGHFDVVLKTVSKADAAVTAMSIEKTFHGTLEAKSTGEMLSVVTPTPGSAGYVAMERVTGTLDGRAGSFVLQHRGVMTRGKAALLVTVVPDSGTGALAGLAGEMGIDAASGHSYTFRYTLPDR